MSTFTNGTGTVNIDYSLLFDLRATPTLVITDTGTYSAQQSNVSITIKITRPDGIVRNPSASADISGTSGSLSTFSYILPLASDDGEPIKGVYKIEYSFTVGSATAVTRTKTFDYQYTKIEVTLAEDLNEFTPLLKVKDTTASYTVTGYTTDSISRQFTGNIAALSKTLHTQTNSATTTAAREYRLEETLNDGKFYDSLYSVSCAVTTNHTNSNYSWVTVKEKITKTISVDAYAVPTKAAMIDYFDSLRNLVETYDGSNKRLYDKYSADYEFVMSSFDHLVRRLDAGDSDDENTDIVKDIIAILRQDIPRTHTNLQLSATSPNIYSSGVDWSSVSGVPTYSPFSTWTQDKSGDTWTINHGLGKYPSVTVVDDNGNIVYGNVTYTNANTVTVSFSAALSGKAYLN